MYFYRIYKQGDIFFFQKKIRAEVKISPKFCYLTSLTQFVTKFALFWSMQVLMENHKNTHMNIDIGIGEEWYGIANGQKQHSYGPWFLSKMHFWSIS